MKDLCMCIPTYDMVYDLSYNKTIFVILGYDREVGKPDGGYNPRA